MPRHASLLPAALLASSAALQAAPAAAQAVNCADLYNRMIALYQSSPQSPEYAQMVASYNGYCGAASSAGPTAGDPGWRGDHGGSSDTLPMRGAPSGTIPTESRAVPAGRHK